MHLMEQKQAKEEHVIIANTVGAHMSHGDTQFMARLVQDLQK